MRVLWIANGVNILVDPLLSGGWGPVPAMEIEGAAIATNIGRAIGVALQIWTLFKGGKHIRVTISQLQWDAQIVIRIWRTSAGGIGQMIISMTSWIFLMRILSDVGSQAVAGATITIRIMMFTMMPA